MLATSTHASTLHGTPSKMTTSPFDTPDPIHDIDNDIRASAPKSSLNTSHGVGLCYMLK